MRQAIEQLRADLIAEVEREEQHLQAICGPKGTRTSTGASIAVAHNDVRWEVIGRLTKILMET